MVSTLPQRGCFLTAAATPNKHTVNGYVVSNCQVYPDPKS